MMKSRCVKSDVLEKTDKTHFISSTKHHNVLDSTREDCDQVSFVKKLQHEYSTCLYSELEQKKGPCHAHFRRLHYYLNTDF